MRCNDCNKFVSFDTEETPVVNDVSVEGGRVIVDVRRVLNCAECGTELKAADLSLDGELKLNLPESSDPESCYEDSHNWEENDNDLEPTEETKYIKGRKTTLYGVSGNVMVRCTDCNLTGEAHIEGSIASGEMEES